MNDQRTVSVAWNQGESYIHESAGQYEAHQFLLPALQRILASTNWSSDPKRILDLGCGNGAVAAWLTRQGYQTTGVDPSTQGLALARQTYPHLDLHEGSAYDDLAGRFGRFPFIVSLEVVEHVYYPRKYAATVYNLLEPGGTAVISTPYHGYLKNVALAVTGSLDKHFTALWDDGHIKFWSFKTLSELLKESGFKRITFVRVGRIPAFARSMIAIAQK